MQSFHYFNIGSISKGYFLVSENYVPERMLRKIDEATSLMIESGLAKFYISSMTHIKKLNNLAIDFENNSTYEAVTLKSLRRPFMLLSGLMGIASAAFAIEIAIYKWKNSLCHRELPRNDAFC